MDPINPSEQLPPEYQPKNSNLGKYLLGILFITVVFAAGFGSAYIFLNSQRKDTPLPTPPNITQSSLSPSNAPTMPATQSKTLRKLVYIRDNLVYTYSFDNKTETQLTKSEGQYVTFSQAQWIDENTVSYKRCERADSSGKSPYSCSIVRHPLSGSTTVLVKKTSQPNSNGYHIGGDILLYEWNHAKTHIAYTEQTVTPDTQDFGTKILHILRISDNTDTVLEKTEMFGGRGGSLEDDVSLHFSPDDSKLLFNDTARYPNDPSKEDKGTVFVYDLKTNSLVWSKPKQWTTFGKWIDTTTFLTKFGEPINQLVRVNLINKKEETLSDAADMILIEPTDKDHAVFVSKNPQQGQGIRLEVINLVTKERKIVRDNVLKLQLLQPEVILAQTMKDCKITPDSCGMDILNGYRPDTLVTTSLQDGSTTSLDITPPNQYFTSFEAI